MRAMRVLRLIVHARTREPVLLLGEIDGERCVPVFLRPAQAEVIAFGPRADGDPPLTQDLIGPIVHGLGRSLEGVEITELRDGVFLADLVFDQDTRIPARPSDALAVAVRDGLPIAVHEAVLDEVGQPIAELFPHGGDAPPADQLREFRQFIDEVSPEDFGDTAG
ncbi:bifunctional nuclease family protein [Pseudonocardia bannensis]|uniref:Bifunctional nuclease family protein n=1 Tax=Pseudonocardia bannensis TaxID=630973 RepID=A0A848DDV6_9PSEU|nr:bifunctional nuclease family protein [Pseudonocardia bannensis]NMH90755.1 bifunctional nuclease family protein [Pseudonocardia bannensis]